MSTFASLVTSLAGPVVKRALSALGIGVLSYAAIQTAFNAAQTALLNQYGQISADVIWLADRAGLGASIGIILGAMAARVGLQAMSKLGRLAT